ncbi:MAG: protein kinase domain-containing protein, partial [Acidobacteriota bacterium]
WLAFRRIFAAAAALERPQRAGLVAVACRHARAWRAALDSLLKAHDQAGSFGDVPVIARAERVKRLAPGSHLGPFRIETLLGAGGMGEVYRAHDTTLRRAVAIKVLPASVADDADRRRRLEQEAVALAALNHPNIGAIYGLEQSADAMALVLELVEGPTLAERLAAGPLAVNEIVWTARQIAEALEAAHDRGIIHRDLKPANIKINPEGLVKVLDFGLAKAVGSEASVVAADRATMATKETALGAVVGTAAYMSPEQARGQPVDRRTDIWAFGCAMFEMCTGEPAFTGGTITDTLAAVLEREPDWTQLDARAPAFLRRLVRRCLTKDPKLRLRDIGEARIALTLGPDAEPAGTPSRRPRPVAAIAAVVTVLVAAVSVATAIYRRPSPAVAPPATPVRFLVFPPEGGFFVRHPARTFFALSPDGSQLAFVGATDRPRVWLRAMADINPRVLPGTDGATSVFWSPDGRSIAFFADAKLKRMDLSDGAAVTICDVPFAGIAHGTWGTGGVILFSSSQGGAIFRVPSAGGSPAEALTPDRANGEVRVHWPSFLPDGRRFLYTARRDDGDGELRLGTLDGATHALMPISSNAQWVDPDIVVFVREGVLMGQRLDLDAARTRGEPFALADRVDYLFTTSRAMFSASQGGAIAYHEYGDLAQLVWADQNGNELGAIGGPADYEFQSVRLSSDGRVLLAARKTATFGTSDIWRLDLTRGTEERLTDDRGVEVTPIFSGDSRAIFFAADRRGGVPNLFRKDLVSGVEEPLLASGVQQLVMDVVPGDGAVVYIQRSKQGTFDIFRLSLAGGARVPAPVLESRHDKFEARVSPDGRAIAFAASDESRTDLYVAPLPITSAPIVAAARVAGPPRWSSDGRRLYYLGSERQVMALAVETSPQLKVGTPQPLFQLTRPALLADVSRDGRFVLLVWQVRAGDRPISVSLGAVRGDRP